MTRHEAWERYGHDPKIGPILVKYFKANTILDELRRDLRSADNMEAIIIASKYQIELREKLYEHIPQAEPDLAPSFLVTMVRISALLALAYAASHYLMESGWAKAISKRLIEIF